VSESFQERPSHDPNDTRGGGGPGGGPDKWPTTDYRPGSLRGDQQAADSHAPDSDDQKGSSEE